MPFEIHRTTAEHVIGATDAALQTASGATVAKVAAFLDIEEESARRALRMALQLGLVTSSRGGRYKAVTPMAAYLVTSIQEHKAAILRLALEQFPPYRTFKERLALTGLAPEAANQTRAIHGISEHREVVQSALIELGTFSNSLVSEGAGLFRPNVNDDPDYLQVLAEVIQDRESADRHVRKRLGETASEWIDQVEVAQHLTTAYQRAAAARDDPHAPIVHAANAVESFLVQLAGHYGVDVSGAHGINAKADTLGQAQHIHAKHKFMLKYLGHLRNAADHGIDPAIGQSWDIAPSTAVEYVHVAISVVSDLVAATAGDYRV